MSVTAPSRSRSSSGPRPKISSITSRSSFCFSGAERGQRCSLSSRSTRLEHSCCSCSRPMRLACARSIDSSRRRWTSILIAVVELSLWCSGGGATAAPFPLLLLFPSINRYSCIVRTNNLQASGPGPSFQLRDQHLQIPPQRRARRRLEQGVTEVQPLNGRRVIVANRQHLHPAQRLARLLQADQLPLHVAV